MREIEIEEFEDVRGLECSYNYCDEAGELEKGWWCSIDTGTIYADKLEIDGDKVRHIYTGTDSLTRDSMFIESEPMNCKLVIKEEFMDEEAVTRAKGEIRDRLICG